MPTPNSQGTQTAVINTEHSLGAPVTNKYFSAYVSLKNMAALDIVELRRYIKVLTASTSEQEWIETYYDAQTDGKIVFFAPLPSDIEWKITLKQTAGTGRDFEWKIYEA